MSTLMRTVVAHTTSLEVARRAAKRHKHILEAIRNHMTKDVEFACTNFVFASYTDIRGKKQPMYYITHDGLKMLNISFTGLKTYPLGVDAIENLK